MTRKPSSNSPGADLVGPDASVPGHAAPMPLGELREDDPPVVARLVVEIRSDGSRTIARGALVDVPSGQQVAVEARGDSPARLAWALTRSILRAPTLARTTLRALLGRRGAHS